jgi:hypothetical protein
MGASGFPCSLAKIPEDGSVRGNTPVAKLLVLLETGVAGKIGKLLVAGGPAGNG